MTPSPRARHQLVVIRLATALSGYLERNPVGTVLASPAGISWGRSDVLVQPDVFVVGLEEARTLEWQRMHHLLLVAEVLSPMTARADRFVKRRRYQEAGVPVHWIVDVEEQRVEVWTPDAEVPRLEDQRLTWHPLGADRPFELPLEELCRPL